MKDLLSSPARLNNAARLDDLKAALAAHGALGHAHRLSPAQPPSELRSLSLLPLVFGLMPRAAFVRTRPDAPIKPIIIQHLISLGTPYDDLLVSLLKGVCEQYWVTRPSNRSAPRKFGMADVRFRRSIYRRLVESQNGRCILCGAPFLGGAVETLDHVIPYRIIGDVPDGANWQIMCEVCNNTKGNYITSLQMLEAHNWVYGGEVPPLDVPLRHTRFIALSQRASCEECGSGPRTAHLSVYKRVATGLAVVDNTIVLCHTHARRS